MTKDKNTILRTADISNIANKDNLDNEVFIFDDIRELPLNSGPFKLMLPIFALCLQGESDISMNLTDYHISPSSLVTLMPGNIIHSCKFSDDFKGLFLGFRAGYSQERINDLYSIAPIVMNFNSVPVINVTDEQRDSIQEFHSFIWRKVKASKSDFSKKSVQYMLQALLFETMDIYVSHINVDLDKRSRNEEIYYEFIALIERHYRESRAVAFYAEKLRITPKHLSAVTKIVSGRTAGDIIDDYVIIAAKVLLCSSTNSIQEISGEMNFANQAFFGKYFKQHAGMTPGEYRSSKSGS
ncbi:MAG: helix-turn-helix domain-containing protein [Bacteroidales bacterium]